MQNPIKQFLAENKLRQKEFAEMLGVSQALVCQWQLGRRKPSLTNALKIEKRTFGQIPASAWVKPQTKAA